jgi:exodeoxyribonuclease VII large subunit
MRTQLVEAKHRLELLAARLDGVSPLKKLSGGYAYVEDEKGEALRSVAQTKPEDSVRIHLKDGTLETTVNKVVQSNAATELELGS